MPKRLPLAAALALLWVVAPAVNAANLPRKSPEFAINLNNGQRILLSQYKGKVVVLAFILTTCPHCQKTIRFLIKDQNELGPRGLQVLVSAIEDGAAIALPGFVKGFNPPFPVGFNMNRPAVFDYLQHPAMLIPHMPILAFIDKLGVIRAQYEGDDKFFDEGAGEQNLRNQIEDLLNEGAPAAKKKSSAAPKK
jgi:thiol-disulfide isomerase/thioredoxin